VSELHCNFLINLGSACAADIEMLGETVRKRVKENSGIELDWEINGSDVLEARPATSCGGGTFRCLAWLYGGFSVSMA